MALPSCNNCTTGNCPDLYKAFGLLCGFIQNTEQANQCAASVCSLSTTLAPVLPLFDKHTVPACSNCNTTGCKSIYQGYSLALGCIHSDTARNSLAQVACQLAQEMGGEAA